MIDIESWMSDELQLWGGIFLGFFGSWALVRTIRHIKHIRRARKQGQIEVLGQDRNSIKKWVNVNEGNPWLEEKWVWKEPEGITEIKYWVNIYRIKEGKYHIKIEPKWAANAIESIECNDFELAVDTANLAKLEYGMNGEAALDTNNM